MLTEPLVSCIMPTHNRRAFVPLAITSFLRQDFPNRELVILDDGSDPVADLVPADPRIRYEHLARRVTLGAKRNIACAAAHGEVIIHWDDDDWSAVERIRVQVEALRSSAAEVSGLSSILFFDPAAGTAWRYHYPPPLVAGSSMCYTRPCWERRKFEPISVGEDTSFLLRDRKILDLSQESIMVAVIHGANTSPKSTQGPRWRAMPVSAVTRIMGADFDHYRTAVPAAATTTLT